MGAIWHDHKQPSFLGIPPSYSFQDVAEIHIEAPVPYAQARARLQRWERKMGAAWFKQNADLAQRFYLAKRPWWITVC